MDVLTETYAKRERTPNTIPEPKIWLWKITSFKDDTETTPEAAL